MLRCEKGFTMVELLLLLLSTVLFINLGLSAHQSMERMKLSMTANQIQTLIRGAQNRAYQEQNTHTIYFSQQNKVCRQVQRAKIINEVKIPKGISIQETTFKANKLEFAGKLGPSGGGGTVQLSSKSQALKITVLPVTGRVKVYPLSAK